MCVSLCNCVFMGKFSLIMAGVSAKNLLCVSKSDEAWRVSTRLECYAASHQPVSIYLVTSVSMYKGTQILVLHKKPHS